MTTAVFKIMLFSILLNVSIGIMVQAFGADNYENIFSFANGGTGGLTYRETYDDKFNEEGARAIQPGGVAADTDSAWERLLEKVGLGVVKKFIDMVHTYLYGIVDFIKAIVGSDLDPGTRLFLFGEPGDSIPGLFGTLITIGYTMGAFYLLSGKKLAD